MRKIAICDDEPAQARLLRGYAKEWIQTRREPAEIQLFPSASAFLFQWEEDKDWLALLLDIQMDGMDGVELARRLRAAGDNLPIIFVTGVPDHVSEGYEVEALHYLMKPVSQEKLSLCLDRAARRFTREPFLLLDIPDRIELRLPQREVALLEANGRRVLVTTADGQTVTANTTFHQLLPLLAEGEFVQCHRSYVVGLRHIRLLGRDKITLDGGREIPVSRRAFPQVNQAFVKFYRQGEE